MSLQFINITKEEFLSKNLLYKYLPLENALRTLSSKELWFADPASWKDPFEKRFLLSEYISADGEEVSIPYGNRVYCMCTTQNSTSEAYWNTYSPDQIGIKFSFIRKELLRQLEAYADSYDIFIGTVEYLKTKEITKEHLSEIPFPTQLPNTPKEIFVRLLLLKRIAYKYEDEIRIILIKKRAGEGEKSAGIKLKYDCSHQALISQVVIGPTTPKHTTELLKETFINKYGFTPDINPDTNTVRHRVFKSSLYSTQLKETIIWDFKNQQWGGVKSAPRL